ncbi:MAG: rhodanese-related sulfurtransferase [Hormoscilla sp. SP5CHS1]|nr:rhodanese-related sulfurtransferase [Hormoscilla sp. SP12CHS1]MBC6452464.1 rhodanese-related sulfurtransferase [Hormoscilla sp. SP5CHS1]MBC6476369.1 rhodanese-related sulfurtransferase [Hormoscilla sp. GM102CHS1]MBO1351762.1 rhodanese-related sulfurtransferase [Hormoscilla sp. GUM202]
MSSKDFSQPIREITVQELATRLKTSTSKLQLLDVREPLEVEMASIAGFEVLPLSQFSEWSTQIHSRFDKDAETVVMCHHGIRSAQMCQWLIDRGFTKVKNLAGGIDAYSILVDRTVPRY